MQIEIYSPAQGMPLPPVQWNFEQLKAELSESLERYRGRVYTADTIQQAKKDRADLNRLAKAINDARIEMKRRYLQPFESFDSETKELIAMVDEHNSSIDAQIKDFDEARKAEKMELCKEVYAEKFGDLCELVPFDRVFDKKWLNVSTSAKAIEDDCSMIVARLRSGLVAINLMESPYKAQAKDYFLRTFDLSGAIAESKRLEESAAKLQALEEKKKAAEEAAERQNAPEAPQAPQQPQEPAQKSPETAEGKDAPDQPETVYRVDFRVYASLSQLDKLKAFLKENNINYGPVPPKV